MSYHIHSFAKHIVPPPSVTVNALGDNVLVGKSFVLECNVMVAKGIDSNVDIIWMVNDTVKRRVNKTIEYINSEYVLYIDVYNTPPLQLSDNNTVYYCKAVINGHTFVESNNSVTLTIGKSIIVCTMQINTLIFICI